jgi:hypothetical protein
VLHNKLPEGSVVVWNRPDQKGNKTAAVVANGDSTSRSGLLFGHCRPMLSLFPTPFILIFNMHWQKSFKENMIENLGRGAYGKGALLYVPKKTTKDRNM